MNLLHKTRMRIYKLGQETKRLFGEKRDTDWMTFVGHFTGFRRDWINMESRIQRKAESVARIARREAARLRRKDKKKHKDSTPKVQWTLIGGSWKAVVIDKEEKTSSKLELDAENNVGI